MTLSPRYAILTDVVCVEARGRDAGAFLHGQLSQSVTDLDATRAPLAAWHDAKGRVRALVRVLRLSDRWLLVGPRDGSELLVNKLRMFVLRAAVTLSVASDVAVAAVIDADDGWAKAAGIPTDTSPSSVIENRGIRFVRVGPTYWQALGDPVALAQLAGSPKAAPPGAAALAEIRLGVPSITTALAERFVAQMLNLDELGAVSFDKGCYPGQEVIARVHNLGGVKRRARRYALQAPPPAPGTAVVAESSQEVGEVVRSAAKATGAEILAVVDHAATGMRLTCGGAPLAEQPLPFPVPRD